MTHVIVPPLKSQGIKTKLVPLIGSLSSRRQLERWIEPFMGTGVVGFNLAGKKATMADSNPHIINFYDALRTKEITPGIARAFLTREGELLAESDGAHYYEVRKRFNESGNSLDFLFLSRSCFNGVMRFNKSGGYNVPFCKKPERFAPAYLTKIVNQIERVQSRILSGDFEFRTQGYTESILSAKRGDLIYCDPPYLGRHVDYFNSWIEDDEKRLSELLKETSAFFILSTWSHNTHRTNTFLDSNWKNFPTLTQQHYYHVGASESNRGGMTEVLVYSPELEESFAGLKK